MTKLTQKQLKEFLHYNPETGIFTWVCDRQGTRKIAGYVHNGYRKICINYTSYQASHLANLYMRGYLPENEMDHLNRIRADDRWKNLRHVSRQCNCRNMGMLKTNTSGVTGVCKNKKRWRATIYDGVRINLGNFKLFKDAVKARWDAEKKLNYPNCQTTSSAYQYLKTLDDKRKE